MGDPSEFELPRKTGISRGTVYIDTHGCKLNQSDSETLTRQLIQSGFRLASSSATADVHIINTCTVTHISDRKARQALRLARRRNKGTFLVATGCYVQRAPLEIEQLGGIDLAVDNTNKGNLVERILSMRRQQSTGEGLLKVEHNLLQPGRRKRATVRIQKGCNQVCAYCIVPKVRGKESSVPPDFLICQINGLVKEGYKEVVLTGTQLGSYGFDLEGVNLTRLLERVLSETCINRIRVSSLQPQEITDEILELWSDKRMCPHFHIPLQSGDDKILKAMRRRYSSVDYSRTVANVNSKVSGVAVTTDVIVGFPGEGPNQFENSIKLARNMEFASMHVFPFSKRPGTTAYYMDDLVSEGDKRYRVGRFLELSQAQSLRYRNSQLGSIRPVLWEQQVEIDGALWYVGHTDNYLKVKTNCEKSVINQITDARLIHDQGDILLTEIVAS